MFYRIFKTIVYHASILLIIAFYNTLIIPNIIAGIIIQKRYYNFLYMLN